MDSKLKFDAHVASVCRKVGGHVNALNRSQNIRSMNYCIKRLFCLISIIAVKYGIIVVREPQRK